MVESVISTIWATLPNIIYYVQTILFYSSLLILPYIYRTYATWDAYFGRKRVTRASESSPSHAQIPNIKSFEENKRNILAAAALHVKNYSTCELLYPLMKNKNKRQEQHSKVINMKARRRQTLVIHDDAKKELLSENRAEELDMDHVYLTFFQYLWACTFIGPNSIYLWIKGTTKLRLRARLQKWGFIEPKPFDPAKIVGRLVLEGSLAVHYYARTDDDSELGDIAGFFFRDFPYIDKDSKFATCDLFAVDIDLKTKKMVKAKFDDEYLTASQALILLWFNTISGNHVKLHSLANWGTNTEPEIKEINPSLYLFSVVTTIYNYFGFTCFSGFMDTWKKMGLLAPDWNNDGWIGCVVHGVKDNIWAHPNITELIPHSRLVKFICTLRPAF